MPTFPITEVKITGLFLESILFGIHFITFGHCIHASRVTNDFHWRRNSYRVVLIASLFFFANATADLFLLFYHILKAFVFHSGGPMEVFTDISDWKNISRSLSGVVQTLVGDTILIYRCWIVNDRSWRVVGFPILLWAACLGSTIWFIYLEATLRSKVLLNAKELRPAEIMICAFTVAVNILTTALIVWRIWSVETTSKNLRIGISREWRGHQSRLRRVMRILIESGLLCTLASLVTFVTFAIGSTAAYVVADAEVQVVGIAFNLIIIRTSWLREGADDDGPTLGGNEAENRAISFRTAIDPSKTMTGIPEMTRHSLSRSDMKDMEP